MKIVNIYFILALGLIFFIIAEGRRGGGSRGGGSRGGSSRGSSSRGSSSRTSQTSQGSSRGTYERKTSKDSSSENKPPTVPAPKPVETPTRPKPSAPEFKETGPSAPNQNKQPAYNPNYKPDTEVRPGVNQQPPPYPGANPNVGNPPPYPGGSGHVGVPPPYPGGSNQARPPPYDTRPYPSGGNPPPYPQQPGIGNQPYPQQPGVGNQPYPRQPGIGNQPYPQQPGVGNQPYPRQPGYPNQPYPQQPGYPNQHYPQQPGSAYQPYPRQPGGAPYPQQPGGYPMYAPPPYVQNSGFPMGGGSYTQPYKKKGLLGQIFSGGGSKSHKPNKYGTGLGGYPNMPHGGNSMGIPKAMYPMMPLMMKAKKPKLFSPSFRRPSFMFFPLFLPFHSPFHTHSHYYHHGYFNDIESENYRGRCLKPLKPNNSTMDCDTTPQGASCNLTCDEGYHFEDNATLKEQKCWHVAGVWRPSKHFPKCLPSCGDKCLNGGKCIKPGVCACDAEYRGERCEHHFLKCDILKFAGENSHNIRFVCRHKRNETTCEVKCRSGQFADEPQSRKYLCQITGEWTPNTIADCVTGNSTTSSPEEAVSTVTSSPKEIVSTTTSLPKEAVSTVKSSTSETEPLTITL